MLLMDWQYVNSTLKHKQYVWKEGIQRNQLVVTSLTTLLLNKFTNIAKDDWNLDEIHANYWNKVW